MLDFVKRGKPRRGRPDAAAPVAKPHGGKGPSIGLALGGGSARGFAHIGVLRTLTKHGIVPDIIAGTSIGAVVGGLYAAGRLDEFEDWARQLTWRRILGYLDFNIAGSGLIGGVRLADNLTRAIAQTRVEDLPIKLTAIATEIGTGHEIWLTRGPLSEALAASYALPGLFPPVRVGGRWLMDGAIVNPVPVSAARAAGARMVISVNLNSYLSSRGTTIQNYGADDDALAVAAQPAARGLRGRAGRILRGQFAGPPGRPRIPTVMIEAFNIMQDRITRARLAGDPPDVSINPRLGGVGWFDFHRAAESIAIGAEATERAMDSILEAVAALSQPYNGNGSAK
jgi:NTE family protein